MIILCPEQRSETSMLTQKQIAEKFKGQAEKHRTAWQEAGLAQAVQDLSRAVRDLKDAGINVSLDMTGFTGEMVFNMFDRSSGPLTVPVAGILHIGNVERLIGIAVRQGTPCLKLAFSDLDFHFQGGES